MKSEAKRRRTKEEIRQQKLEEEIKQREIEAKLERFEQNYGVHNRMAEMRLLTDTE